MENEMNTEKNPLTPEVEVPDPLETEGEEVLETQEKTPEEILDITKKALEAKKYEGANLVKLGFERTIELLENSLTGVPAKEVLKAIRKVRLEKGGVDLEIGRVEQEFVGRAVQETETVMELMELVSSEPKFAYETFLVGEKSYRYAKALQEVVDGVLPIKALPNKDIQAKLQSLGVRGKE